MHRDRAQRRANCLGDGQPILSLHRRNFSLHQASRHCTVRPLRGLRGTTLRGAPCGWQTAAMTRRSLCPGNLGIRTICGVTCATPLCASRPKLVLCPSAAPGAPKKQLGRCGAQARQLPKRPSVRSATVHILRSWRRRWRGCACHRGQCTGKGGPRRGHLGEPPRKGAETCSGSGGGRRLLFDGGGDLLEAGRRFGGWVRAQVRDAHGAVVLAALATDCTRLRALSDLRQRGAARALWRCCEPAYRKAANVYAAPKREQPNELRVRDLCRARTP